MPVAREEVPVRGPDGKWYRTRLVPDLTAPAFPTSNACARAIQADRDAARERLEAEALETYLAELAKKDAAARRE